MAYITVGTENSADIELYYTDQGSGQPVVLIHGFLAERRVVGQAAGRPPRCGLPRDRVRPARLRRVDEGRLGLRLSTRSPPTSHALMRRPRPRDAVLVGSSMGTGEIARYLSRYGSERVAKAVFLASLEPYLLEDRRQPRRRGAAGVLRRHRRVGAQGPLRLPHRLLQGLLQPRREPRLAHLAGGARRQRADREPRGQRGDRRRTADLADGLPRRHPADRRARADRARHRRQHPADRRRPRAGSRTCCPTRPTSRSRAPRTGCCGPTATRSTRRCSPSWTS